MKPRAKRDSSEISLSKARSYALRLIKFRLRSEKELRDSLCLKGAKPSDIDEVMSFLKRAGLLDDELFARLWVESRVKKPLGFKRLARELKNKGISENIIEGTIRQAREDYSEDDAIRSIIAVRLKKMNNLSKDKAMSRLYGFLMRRGYAHDKVYEALRSVL